MYSQLNSVNKFSTLLIVIGVVYLIYLTISIFIENIREPLPLIISHLIWFRNFDGDVKHNNTAWLTAAFKFSGFMCAICFLMLGTYISYYKSVIKVDAMNQVYRATVLFLTCFCVIGFIHSVFVIFFCITQDLDYDGRASLESYSTASAIVF